MHTFVLVIIPGDTAFEQMMPTVKQLLAPYGDDREVEPYKYYLSEEERVIMAKHFHVPLDDLSALLPYVRIQHGQEGGIDAHGLYYMSTINPQARWSSWVIGGRWAGAIENNVLKKDEKGLKPHKREGTQSLESNVLAIRDLHHQLHPWAIITPDGKWHGLDWEDMNDELRQKEWTRQVNDLLKLYPGDLLVGVDCFS